MIRRILLASAVLVLSIFAAPAHADPNCAKLTQMTLTVEKYHLDLNDSRPVCITVPGAFKINIKNLPNTGVTVGAGDVTVVQKNDPAEASVIIEGVNGADGSPVNKVAVEVRPVAGKNVETDDEFEFWIHVEGVGKLDPRIKVVGNEFLQSLQWAEIDDTLDTLDLELEDVFRLQQLSE